MRNTWDHLAVVLYAVGIILLCLFMVYGKPEKNEVPTAQPNRLFKYIRRRTK